MRVRLLGGLSVDGLSERDLGSRKARTLLKLLALAGGSPVAVDTLVEALWGDDPPARPGEQVGVLVSRLRGALGSERIVRTDAGYALLADWVDVNEVRDLAAAATTALAEGRTGAARAAAGAAMAAARGPLLPDEEGAWVEAERATVAIHLTAARRVAIDAAVAAGDLTGATSIAEQVLSAEPYDEAVLRALMRAHLAARRPAAALAAYARVREQLAEELGVPPTAETEALHAQALAAADGDVAHHEPPAVRTRPSRPIAGRAPELASLDAALAEAEAGGRGFVLIEGDAGMGKTTLVDAWLAGLTDGRLVLRGRCDELGRDLPLQPIADAVADHFTTIGAARAETALGADAGTLAPFLGPVAGEPATAVSDPDERRAQVFTALVNTIGRAAEDRTTILVIEDLHFAGPATAAWIAFAHRRCDRTLLVATTRSTAGLALSAPTHLRLEPLTLEAAAELVGTERAADLHARSGGHPLLLTAFATAAEGALPPTVRGAVATQLATLGDATATTVRVAAALGVDCDIDLVAQVAGLSAVETLSDLEDSLRTGLVVEHGARFAFRHELVRQAIDETTGPARRAFVQQQAARVLASRPSVDALAVAVHAKAGGDPVLAASFFVEAATRAAARFDVAEAEQYLAEALALDATAKAFAARARLRMSQLRHDEAAEDAAKAIALRGGAAAHEVSGWVAYYRRRYDEARAHADAAIAMTESDGSIRVSALALAGRIRHAAGDLEDAVARLSTVGDAPLAVRGVADVWLSHARVHQGRPEDALETLSRPLVDPDSLAHPWAPLHLRLCRAMALGQLGRVQEALAVTDELEIVTTRAGDLGRRFAAVGANVNGWLLRWTGRGDAADERNLFALEATGGQSGPASEGLAEPHYVAILDLLDGALLRGDLAAAAAWLEPLSAVDTWNGTMAWHQRHRLELARARLALRAGDNARASELAATVVDDASTRGAGRYELLARAIAGIADPALPPARLAPVIEGLARCAALEGWMLTAELARVHKVEEWRREAERRAAALVSSSDDKDAARVFVESVLSR